MPRKPFEPSSEDFYHACARTNNRDWFSVPMEVVWRIMTDQLYFAHHAFGVQIVSFVLMENHFHLIARFPELDFSEAMQYFMRETSRAIAHASGRINHVYGGRIFRTRLTTDHHFKHVYKYVYRNPVEAKIVQHAESYRYSTLSGLLGSAVLHIPVMADPFLFDAATKQTLQWLNETPRVEHTDAVRDALRKPVFKFHTMRSSRRQHALDTLPY